MGKTILSVVVLVALGCSGPLAPNLGEHATGPVCIRVVLVWPAALQMDSTPASICEEGP